MAALNLELCKATPLEVDLPVSNRGFFDVSLPRVQNVGPLTVNWFSSIEELVQVLPKFTPSTPNYHQLLTLRATRANGASPPTRLDR